jgi:hypothetical protein
LVFSQNFLASFHHNLVKREKSNMKGKMSKPAFPSSLFTFDVSRAH